MIAKTGSTRPEERADRPRPSIDVATYSKTHRDRKRLHTPKRTSRGFRPARDGS
jgi:hypothetical protein